MARKKDGCDTQRQSGKGWTHLLRDLTTICLLLRSELLGKLLLLEPHPLVHTHIGHALLRPGLRL